MAGKRTFIDDLFSLPLLIDQVFTAFTCDGYASQSEQRFNHHWAVTSQLIIPLYGGWGSLRPGTRRRRWSRRSGVVLSRAPLRAINGYAHIIEEDYSGLIDDEGRRLIGVVRRNATKMGQVIDDLLTFSRLGRKPLSTGLVNVRALVTEVISNIVDAVPGVNVEVGNLPDVCADRSLLKQVWENLIGNAVKYSSSKPMACVVAGAREEPDKTVYWVKDNGAGFDMRYADKLCGVFQRLHNETEFPGTGLGLAIVRSIVTKHGGRVWAEGKVNEGASFYFSLPRRTRI